MIRIGVNTLFMIPKEVGGSETYLRQTLQNIVADFSGVSLVLFTNKENDEVLRADLKAAKQVEFVKLELAAMNRYARIFKEQTELRKLVNASNVDVLWSPGYTAPWHVAIPQVTSILDMQYKSFPEDMSLQALLVTNALVQLSARVSRRIIAISEFSRDEIVKYTRVSPDKVDVTRLGVNSAFGIPMSGSEQNVIRRAFGCVEKPFLLSVSNTYPHKNIHTLVRAFGKVCEKVPHSLVLVGSQRLGETAVEDEVAKLKDPSRVIRLERLTLRELRGLYQACDAVVHPSLYEGFGLPVLEAMMSRVPVIAGRRAAVPEVAGDTILYCDVASDKALAEKIMSVAHMDPRTRERLIEIAAIRAAGFTWRRTAAETIASLGKAAMGQQQHF